MVADIFTKPLDEIKFNKFNNVLLNVRWAAQGLKAKVGRLKRALEKSLAASS